MIELHDKITSEDYAFATKNKKSSQTKVASGDMLSLCNLSIHLMMRIDLKIFCLINFITDYGGCNLSRIDDPSRGPVSPRQTLVGTRSYGSQPAIQCVGRIEKPRRYFRARGMCNFGIALG